MCDVPPRPIVTVVLPVHNEAAYIRQSLGSVFAQDYPADKLEILVVDGMSEDSTRQIVTEMILQNPQIEARLIDNPAVIVPNGLNIGIAQAHGEILVRIDGHCEIPAQYVGRCVEHLHDESISGVGGPIENVANTLMGRTIGIAMNSAFGVGGAAFRTGGSSAIFVDSVAFPAYTRQTLSEVGLFDEELACNEDDEFNYRIREMGGLILLSPDVNSRYYVRTSLRKLWKQYYRYGLWKIRVLQKHPLQMSLRQFAPPLLVIGLVLSALLTVVAFMEPLSVRLHRSASFFVALGLVLPGLYLLTALSASILLSAARGWKYLPLLPVTFAVLHLSYGLGFLVGLVKFANRWGDRLGKVPAWDSRKPV